VDVSCAAEEVIERGQGQGGFGFGGGRLHGDLAHGVDEEAEREEVGDAVALEEVDEGTADERGEGGVAGGAVEVSAEAAEAAKTKGGQEPGVVEDGPQGVGDGALAGEEGAQAFGGGAGERRETVDQRGAGTGDGQGEVRGAQFDDGVEGEQGHREVVALDPDREERAGIEAGEQGGAGFEGAAGTGEGAGAAAGVAQSLAQDDGGPAFA
jgi:hypothetical protein